MPMFVRPANVGMIPVTRMWHTIVQNYSYRGLTNPSDKLSALAGTAQMLHQKAEEQRLPLGRYLAGLWSKTFRKDLLWFVSRSSACESRHAERYRAPSWSWASVDGHIEYHGHAGYRREPMSVRILDVQTTTVDPNHNFGQVASGYARIAGRTLEATVVRSHGTWLRSKTDKSRMVSHSSARSERRGEEIEFHSDSFFVEDLRPSPAETVAGKDIPVTLVYIIDGFALVLARDGEEGNAFRRIGCVEHVGMWFYADESDAEEKELLIL